MLKRGLRSKLRRIAPANLADAARAARSDDVLLVGWVNRGPVRDNWGDFIAPELVRRLSGKQVVNQRDVLNLAGKPVYTTIGSMLGTIQSPKAVVWGTGFVDSGSTLQTRPAQVCAVRGPRSRQKLIDAGVACPEVYGDPALLAPMFWKPAGAKTHKIGVIPHFRDYGMDTANRLGGFEGARVIDICGGLDQVVEEITACDFIVSGSLHGLVCADAYGIPAAWIQFSERAFGDGFKFRDYLDSVGGRRRDPLIIDGDTTLAQLEDLYEEVDSQVDVEAFLDACPFLDRSQLPPAP